MKYLITLSLFFAISVSALSQIDPLLSPYFTFGSYEVESFDDNTVSPDVKIWRPLSTAGAPYPTILFQPGANGFFQNYIDKHSYDIYLEHIASYGYVVVIINNTSGGPNANLFKNVHNWIKGNVNSESHWMKTYVDLNRFIVGGHSNGSMNATDIIIDRPSEIQAIFYWGGYPNPGDILGMGSQNVSNYTGKVLIMCGSEDNTSMVLLGSTNNIAWKAYDERFTSVNCKTWTMLAGVGHGGFGDYNNPNQAVGSIGRDSVTATVRHIFVSFMNSQFYGDNIAFDNLNSVLLRPSTVSEYENTCTATGSTTELDNNIVNRTNIYPNPANSLLNIKTDEMQKYTIYTITGSAILSGSLNNQDSNIINIENLSSGLYIIKLSNDTITSTHKLLID